MQINGSLIPGTFANFNRLFETSSSQRATVLKQKMQNIVMATLEFTLSLGPGYAVVEKGKRGVK